MKFQPWGKLLFVALALMFFASCRTAPIYNVDHQAIATPAGKSLTMKQVRAAIVRAGASRGWAMKDAGPGHLVGTLHLRTHVAVVDIRYTTKYYSIHYKSSKNLRYDGKHIHSNYNGWIENLQHDITTQLTLA